MDAVGKINQTYPSLNQLKIFYNKIIVGKYTGTWSKMEAQEYRAACIHAISSIRRTIEQVI